MEGLEVIWKAYESLEKQVSETLAEQVLPEFNEKYIFSKMIYEKRKLLYCDIDLERLSSSPPSNSCQELKQLHAWNRLTMYELSNPEEKAKEVHRSYMQLHFTLALGPLRLYPEVAEMYVIFLSC